MRSSQQQEEEEEEKISSYHELNAIQNVEEDQEQYPHTPSLTTSQESHFSYIQMQESSSPAKILQGPYEFTRQTSMASDKTIDAIIDPVGFLIVCSIVLIGDMSRGVMFPTLWPLIESLDGTKIIQGYAVAAFSFGRFIMAPIFGKWSVSHGYTVTLRTSMCILLLGTLFYAQVPNVNNVAFLILAQCVMGIGSATLGVTRAFVADVTPHLNRTKYISWLTAVQFGGFTVTPILGALISSFFQDDREISIGLFLVNAYTAPAYFMSILCIFILVVMRFHFQNRNRDVAATEKRMKRTPSDVLDFSATRTCFNMISRYEAALLSCMFLNIISKGSISVFETLGIVIANEDFDVGNSSAGYFVGLCGLIGVISLLSMQYIGRILTDVQMIVFGMVVMMIGMFNLVDLNENGENPVWRYCCAFFMVYSIGYPIGHTAAIALFSKIVGRKPQGTLQGMFASAGSLARMLFPVSSGYMLHYTGTTTLFGILVAIMGSTVIFAFLNKKTFERLI